MKPEDVPEALIDIAMAGAAPGCRDDAAFYLANALPAIEAETLAGVEQRVESVLKAKNDQIAELRAEIARLKGESR